MVRLSGLLFLVAGAAAAAGSPDIIRKASALYEHTEYTYSLNLLKNDPAPDAAALFLSGKNYFMLADYQRAIDSFEKSLALSPRNSEIELWLGRAWGRRAETAGWFAAGFHASRARQCFERAVAWDPRNREAKNDLFDFYLNAPGFLGGGIEKAEAIAQSIAAERPAESEFERAQIADRKKEYAAAEAHFRRAIELAPGDAGRVVDLARYLARRGRLAESDALFDQARKLAPGRPSVAFAEARVDIENHRKLEHARELLEQYLRADLTPEDPPRQQAEKLLRGVPIQSSLSSR
jgi:Flp pilus assembly protein TadD